jgi:uncharacterized protein (DUF2336 family)
LGDAEQKLVRELFATLAVDATPMVRRAAAAALGSFAAVQVYAIILLLLFI